jgi:hypothetical protein
MAIRVNAEHRPLRRVRVARLYIVYAHGSIEAKIPMKVKAIPSGIVRLY